MSYLRFNRRGLTSPTIRGSFYDEENETEQELLIVYVRSHRKPKKGYRKGLKVFWKIFRILLKLVGFILALDMDFHDKLF